MKKRIFAIITTVLILSTLIAVFPFELIVAKSALPMGDINADGKVNGRDVTLFLKYLADWNVTVRKENANVNGDTKVNGMDATLLLKYLAGWNVSFTERIGLKVRFEDISKLTASLSAENMSFTVSNDETEGNVLSLTSGDGFIGKSVSLNFASYRDTVEPNASVIMADTLYSAFAIKVGSTSATSVTVKASDCNGNTAEGNATFDNQSSDWQYLMLENALTKELLPTEIERIEFSFDGEGTGTGVESIQVAFIGFTSDKEEVHEMANFELIHPIYNTIEIPGLKHEYTFVQITDTHLSSRYEDEQIDSRDKTWIDDRNYGKVNGLMTKEDMLQLLCDYSNSINANYVLLTGDIIDTPTQMNFDNFNKSISSLNCGCMFSWGNHDWTYVYGNGGYLNFAQGQKTRSNFYKATYNSDYFCSYDFGDLVICSLDNTLSEKDGIYSVGTLKSFNSLYKQCKADGKPLIMLQHVPFYSDSALTNESKRIWGSDITYGGVGSAGGSYGYVTRLNTIYKMVAKNEDSPVKAVIAGHMHFNHEGVLENGTPQFVTDVGSNGTCRVFTIKAPVAE